MLQLEGRHAVLTGASGGVGRALARALAARGVHLALVARGGKGLESLAGALSGYPVQVETYAADLTDDAQRRNLPLRIRGRFEEVDLLVNAVGIEEHGAFPGLDPARAREVLESNLVVPMLLTLAFLPGMLDRGRGHVVNIASLAALLGMPYAAVYAAAKGALSQLGISLAGELGSGPVGISTVCATFVEDAGSAHRRRRRPPLLGTTTTEAVAGAAMEAILGNRAELIVGGWMSRPLLALRAVSPRAMGWLARRAGLTAYLEGIAREGRT